MAKTDFEKWLSKVEKYVAKKLGKEHAEGAVSVAVDRLFAKFEDQVDPKDALKRIRRPTWASRNKRKLVTDVSGYGRETLDAIGVAPRRSCLKKTSQISPILPLSIISGVVCIRDGMSPI